MPHPTADAIVSGIPLVYEVFSEPHQTSCHTLSFFCHIVTSFVFRLLASNGGLLERSSRTMREINFPRKKSQSLCSVVIFAFDDAAFLQSLGRAGFGSRASNGHRRLYMRTTSKLNSLDKRSGNVSACYFPSFCLHCMGVSPVVTSSYEFYRDPTTRPDAPHFTKQ